MTVPLLGDDGLATRLGGIIHTIDVVNEYRGTDLPARVEVHQNSYDADDADNGLPGTIDGIYQQLAGWQSGAGTPLSYLRTLAQNTIRDQVALDVQLPDNTWQTAWRELVRQMDSSSDTFDRPNISTAVATGSSNTGTAVCAVSTTNPDGTPSVLIYDEAVDVRCTQDAQAVSGAGAEVYTVKGERAQTDMLHWEWPLGSGAQVTVRAQNPGVASTTSVNNGSFDTVPSANTFTYWTVDVGTAGTHILSGGSSAALGATGNVLQFVGDGSNLTSVYQDLTALSAGIKPSTAYAIGVWLKADSAPAAGVLTFSLTDSSGTVLTDAEGTACTLSVTCSSITTSYVCHKGFIRTPAVLPATIRLRIKMTTAVTSGRTVSIDYLTMSPGSSGATRLYPGGPYVAVFAGATKALVQDYFTATFTNDYGGQFVNGLWRMLDLGTLGVSPPTAASGTITDALIE